MPKIARYEFLADGQPRISCENHVREPRLRRDEMNFAIQSRQGVMKTFPLLLGHRCFSAARPTHPGIDFVLDPVVIRRTK
jgi:hypothetical protein